MRYNHRSEKLDALLNKKVKIVFWDDKTAKGILIWNERAGSPPRYLASRGYYLNLIGESGCLHFKKSHVKKIEKL